MQRLSLHLKDDFVIVNADDLQHSLVFPGGPNPQGRIGLIFSFSARHCVDRSAHDGAQLLSSTSQLPRDTVASITDIWECTIETETSS